MDFATEPVMDAFVQQPRAPRPAAQSADLGPTFDEHLEAEVSQYLPADAETKSEAPPVQTQPVAPQAELSESTDPTTALLGAPHVQPTPPPVAAVILQMTSAASAPVAPAGEAAPVQPAAPQPAQAPAPPQPSPLAAPPQPQAKAAASTPEGKNAPAAPTSAAPTAPQAERAAAAAPQPINAAPQQMQPAPTQPASAAMPLGMHPAIAATPAPAPTAQANPAPRAAKTPAAAVESKPAPESRIAGPATPNAKAAKVVATATPVREATQAPQVLADAPEAMQSTSTQAATATTAQAGTHVQHAAADAGAQRATPAAAQVAREIIRRFDGSNTSFELRLDPPELGRVEVRMEVSRDHRVTAIIAAESPEALTELARHARELEAQLQSAGLQLSENGLSFDLRQGAQSDRDADANTSARAPNSEDAAEQTQTIAARPIGFERWRGVRVDMMV